MLGSYGYLPNDRRHQFKAFGSYKVFDWMQLGATVIAIAPRKFGCLGTVASSVSSPALIRSGASYDYGYAYGAAGQFCVLDRDGSGVPDPQVGTGRSLVRRVTAVASAWLTPFELSTGRRKNS